MGGKARKAEEESDQAIHGGAVRCRWVRRLLCALTMFKLTPTPVAAEMEV